MIMMTKPMLMKWPGGKGETDIQVLAERNHLKDMAAEETTLQLLFKKQEG
jgi:hypothetical protein